MTIREETELSFNAVRLFIVGMHAALARVHTTIIGGELDDVEETFRYATSVCKQYPELGIRVRQSGRQLTFEPVEDNL